MPKADVVITCDVQVNGKIEPAVFFLKDVEIKWMAMDPPGFGDAEVPPNRFRRIEIFDKENPTRPSFADAALTSLNEHAELKTYALEGV